MFVPVAIGPRALDVLGVLIERAGQLIAKEEIIAAVWGRSVVENANLTVQIAAPRRVLDEGQPEGSCIRAGEATGACESRPAQQGWVAAIELPPMLRMAFGLGKADLETEGCRLDI